MILFLNFAPIEFMGGAEKWMYETACMVNKKEATTLMSVSPNISNIYSRLVLKRKYDSRASKLIGTTVTSLHWSSFVPFTTQFQDTIKLFKNARKIYIRYEVLELCILIYFGGFSSLKKTISGIHFPLSYPIPETLLQKLHNYVYMSAFSIFMLRKAGAVHVITPRDRDLLSSEGNLKNVQYIPTSTKMKVDIVSRDNRSKNLCILFVGELSKRKGCDILLDVIRKSPKTMKFLIAGNGEMLNDVNKVSEENKNVTYYGYLSGAKLAELYKKADVLFLPSRAEGFPLVFHEAMINGLVIVDSKESQIGLSELVERSATNSNAKTYITSFQKLLAKRPSKGTINNFYRKHFSSEVIDKQLNDMFFS